MRTSNTDDLSSYLTRWGLEIDGTVWETESSKLAHVHRHDGATCVLKKPRLEEERLGSRVLAWWSGDGAAEVYEIDTDGTVLLERAVTGSPLLVAAETATALTFAGDEGATVELIKVAQRLHRRRDDRPPNGLMSLRRWFRGLFSWADQVGGFYRRSAGLAEELLSDQRDDVVLHGDLHHENVLWFGAQRGWLAIDPKGIHGDPAFDYASLLTNPGRSTILRPGRLERHADLISAATGIEPLRLLRWTVAWAGLSAAWHQQTDPTDRAADMLQLGQLAERRSLSLSKGT